MADLDYRSCAHFAEMAVTKDEIAKLPTPETDAVRSVHELWTLCPSIERRLMAVLSALERCVLAASKDVVEDFSQVSNAADNAAQTILAIKEFNK